MTPNLTKRSWIIAIVFLWTTNAFSQAVNPFHLFNTGLNMGFLSAHVKNHTGQANYGTWAANAAAEWLESWEPGFVKPITPDITMPSVAHNDIIYNIMHMGTCFNPYFQARLALYRAGFHMGEALVQTGTSCADCLRLDLQKSAIELRTISTLIRNPLFAELSDNLNSIAASLKSNLSGELSMQQNQSQFEPINSIIASIQADLPDALKQCEQKENADEIVESTGIPVATATNESLSPKENERKKKRGVALKIGLNSGSLNGDTGHKTEGKTGWLIGLDYFRGDPVFFVAGTKFWRNSAGEELMVPLPSQQIDDEKFYIQGFTGGLGLGGNVYKNDEVKISFSGKLNYLISHAINGNLSSVGNTILSDGAFHLEIGGQMVYKLLFLELSYEHGLSEAFTSGTEKYTYRLFNVSAGIYLN